MKAELVYFYAYDVASELFTDQMKEIFGRRLAPLQIEPFKRSPTGVVFHRPLTIALDPVEGRTPKGPLSVQIILRLFSIGAMSIMARVPVEYERLEDLHAYHRLPFEGRSLDEEVRTIAARVLDAIRPYAVKCAELLVEPETYTVFCLHAPPEAGSPAAEWFHRERRRIAALLTDEYEPARLSEQEVTESTQYHYSYYRDDVVVVDWDAALVVDNPRAYDEMLYVFEIANLQLEELSEYGRILDAALNHAYDDLVPSAGTVPRGRARIQSELREIRVDLARLTDELNNATRFFGDWHLARIYEGVARRFHLGDWADSVNQKLRTLESMYNLLQQERTNRWMLLLESAIVALFLLDLAALIWKM